MGYKSDKSGVVGSRLFLLEVNWLILGGFVDRKGIPYIRHRWGRGSCVGDRHLPLDTGQPVVNHLSAWEKGVGV